MLPVSIDISDFVQTWSLTTQETELFVYSVLDEIGKRYYDALFTKAGQELKQTRAEYQRAIYIEAPTEDSISIGLAGWLPNAIEQGIQPFDMKEGFSRSDKRKPAYRKNASTGWYLTIPFRHGTPGIVADSGIFSTVMPGPVYQAAKSLLKTENDLLRVKDLPPEFQIKGVRKEVVNNITKQVFPEYTHKSSIYEGMKKSSVEHHSQYVTFRRVSDLSDVNSWIHSGIEAHNLMMRTLETFPIDRVISEVKESFLSNR